MDKLEPPDSFHLDAATGWLELGNLAEARIDLNKIAPPLQGLPMVLEVRWRIEAEAKEWQTTLELAESLCRAAPDDPAGWIHQSYSLHELKRTQQAYDALLAVVDRFPEVMTVPYNLACYACQLKETEEAWKWLLRAMKIQGPKKVKAMALKDEDLEPLWKEIRSL